MTTTPDAPRTVDALVIGAGLAGLCAAIHLARAGVEVAVVEASDDVGGRMRTDEVDGLVLDRGFQLYNPSYPEGRRMLELDGLDLQPYDRGVVVASGSARRVVADPLHHPGWTLSSALAPVGSPIAKIRFAAYAVRAATGAEPDPAEDPDVSIDLALARRGVRGPVVDRLLRPFLAGVFGESELSTSRRFADLVLRAFVRGRPSLPAKGMGEIPRQLARHLPPGNLTLSCPVTAVSGTTVRTARGVVTARAVVIATDGVRAAELDSRVKAPAMRALTTYYHLAPEPPTARRLLHLDADRRGPVVNSSVVTNVAPTYARDGQHLVSSTVLGAHSDAATEGAVRDHLTVIYGVPTTGWTFVRSYPIPRALPAMLPPLDIRQPVDLGGGGYVAGDHRDNASIQGAMVSGRRAAQAAVRGLGA